MLRQWHDTEYSLTYSLGDIKLGSKRFTLRSCELGVAGHRSGESFVLPSIAALPQAIDGYAIRGLPIATERPVFERTPDQLVYTPATYQRYFIEFTGTFDDYKKRFSSKSRSSIVRKVNGFRKHCGGEIDFRCYQLPGEMAEFLGYARLVSRLTYQERLLGAGISGEPEYDRQLAENAAKDLVRGYVLFLKDQPVSYLLLNVVGDALAYSRLGYDPAQRSWSVGTVLHWLAIEALFSEQKFRLLDFTEGEGEHKRRFSTGSRLSANVLIFRPSLLTSFLLKLHRGIDRLSVRVGLELERWGLKSKLKKLMRT